MAAGKLEKAKRAFVALLLSLARVYKLALEVNRESDEACIQRAYRRVVLKAHPDKGGTKAQAHLPCHASAFNSHCLAVEFGLGGGLLGWAGGGASCQEWGWELGLFVARHSGPWADRAHFAGGRALGDPLGEIGILRNIFCP